MNTTTTDLQTDADRALKAKHRIVWALGDYSAVAREVIPELARVLVAESGVGPGDRVLDVAAGTGNASIEAARAGASVVASDLTPELLEIGRQDAARQGVELVFEEADAEALPYADDAFDVVLSCVGVMFAPHHEVAALELTRVARPGGRLALINWTPEGFVGQLFATMKQFVPAPPAGVQPPPLWGDEQHVRDLLGDRVTDLTMQRRRLAVDRFGSGVEFRDFFRDFYGPTAAAYRAVGDDEQRRGELDDALAALGEKHLDGGTMPWEYLLVTARVV
ncbi:methyltransferase domain-containing protein [Microbacterium sp. ISL-103]|uniref:class I SAM-dependent methyltransferase n=1 Tax=Microbacterium sp. ISL-103 TaxID=2819156 RepID=UPI001BE8A011|nr:methyltransferase domain-containing protein [Microbacterium sp. ISL-103]MBT2476161.1 methyltransferase domain-containing protein [Microbacterium sp. ISL-103]